MIHRLLFISFLFLLFGCGSNIIENDFIVDGYRVQSILYAKNSVLKYVYKVNGNDKELWDEYEYNIDGKVSRINHYPSSEELKAYSIYMYNEQGQIDKVDTYQQYTGDSPILTHSVGYSYNSESVLAKEEHTSVTPELCFSITFSYDNNKINKKEFYFNEDQTTSFVVFDYDDDKLIKEKSYDMDGNYFQTIEYSYAQNLLVYFVTYKEDPKQGLLRDETRYYDMNDNLIRVVQKDALLSSSSIPITMTWDYEYK